MKAGDLVVHILEYDDRFDRLGIILGLRPDSKTIPQLWNVFWDNEIDDIWDDEVEVIK